jgi:hypothetical protein
MALFKQTCPQCGYQASASARFCPECGAALGGTKPCVHCQAQIPTAAQFCPQCGRPQSETTRQPDVRGSVWRSSSDEFAVRIERDDLKGRFFKDLEIQPGQQAVFLIDGRAEAERQGPGRYQVDSFFEKLLSLGSGRHVTALVVRGDPVPLEFQLPKLYTSDDFELGGRVVLAVQVANPPAFFANVMRSRQTLTLAELRSFLFDQVRSATQDVVGRRTLGEFKQQSLDLRFKDNLTTVVMQHLEQTLRDSGLAISQVVVSDFVHPRFDALRRQREDTYLFREEVEAARAKKLAGSQGVVDDRKGLWEVQLETEDQETLEQRAQARIFEERAQVREQMRQAVLSERMNEVRNEQQLAVFLRGIDKDKLLRDDEWQRMQRDFAERKEEHDLARAHLLAQLKMERDFELRMAQGLRSHELTTTQLAQQRTEEQYRQQTQMQVEEERATWDIRMQRQRNEARRAEQDAEAAAQRERQTQDRMTQLDLMLRDARTQAEIEAIEREQDRLDLDLAMQAMERLKAVKRKDEEERQLIALRTQREQAEITLMAEQRRLTMQLLADRQRHEQELAAQAQQQRYELDRLERFSQMGPEALIAASGAEQGALLISLARTKALEGKDAEQILAMAAENSPAVAEAFKEKYRAMAEGKMAEREQALYMQLVAEQKEMVQAQRQMADDQARRQQELATDALRTQADVAKAFAASRPAAGPTVVIPGGGTAGYGGATVVGGSGDLGGGEVQICPSCRVKQPVGTKFCTNCGHKFFD